MKTHLESLFFSMEKYYLSLVNLFLETFSAVRPQRFELKMIDY